MTINDDKEEMEGGAGGNAEGQHGSKTHERIQEQLQSARPGEAGEKTRESNETHSRPDKHRLFEDREQQDGRKMNSEESRSSRDIERHGHDREQFQVPGGKARHPEMPDEG